MSTTDPLQIPDMILKLRVFIPFFYTSYFPYDGQNVTLSNKSNGNFSII